MLLLFAGLGFVGFGVYKVSDPEPGILGRVSGLGFKVSGLGFWDWGMIWSWLARSIRTMRQAVPKRCGTIESARQCM